MSIKSIEVYLGVSEGLGKAAKENAKVNCASAGIKVKTDFVKIFDEKENDFFSCVSPYLNLYTTFAKKRWCSRKLIDILESEFKWRTREYFTAMIEKKNILVNDRECSPNYVIRNNDKITHLSFNIELASLGYSVRVLFENDNFIVAHKPAGIPVQSQGRFQKQSLMFILKRYYLNNTSAYLHPIFRLDKVTSGLVILSKSSITTSIFTSNLSNAKKFYVAKVKGKFILSSDVIKNDETKTNSWLNCLKENNMSKKVNHNIEVSKKRKHVFSHEELDTKNKEKVGFFKVSAEEEKQLKRQENDDAIRKEEETSKEKRSKEDKKEKDTLYQVFVEGTDIIVCSKISKVVEGEKHTGRLICDITNSHEASFSVTAFKLLHFNGEDSLVLCRPLTGKTHQIRIHLKCLNFFIINDLLYLLGDSVHLNLQKDLTSSSYENFNLCENTQPCDINCENTHSTNQNTINHTRIFSTNNSNNEHKPFNNKDCRNTNNNTLQLDNDLSLLTHSELKVEFDIDKIDLPPEILAELERKNINDTFSFNYFGSSKIEINKNQQKVIVSYKIEKPLEIYLYCFQYIFNFPYNSYNAEKKLCISPNFSQDALSYTEVEHTCFPALSSKHYSSISCSSLFPCFVISDFFSAIDDAVSQNRNLPSINSSAANFCGSQFPQKKCVISENDNFGQLKHLYFKNYCFPKWLENYFQNSSRHNM